MANNINHNIQLPQDVCNLIINQVDDIESLVHFSRVSKTWLDTAARMPIWIQCINKNLKHFIQKIKPKQNGIFICSIVGYPNYGIKVVISRNNVEFDKPPIHKKDLLEKFDQKHFVKLNHEIETLYNLDLKKMEIYRTVGASETFNKQMSKQIYKTWDFSCQPKKFVYIYSFLPINFPFLDEINNFVKKELESGILD